MSNHIEQTISDLQVKLHAQEEESLQTKRLINLLCKEAGLDLLYDNTEATSMSLASMRPDQFFGRPLATVIKEYLNMRRTASKGAASTNEIYDTLRRGGYAFQAKNDENAKRGIQISLAKNRDFMRVPNGAWGLTEWYPNARTSKSVNGKAHTDGTAASSDSVSVAVDEEPKEGAQVNA